MLQLWNAKEDQNMKVWVYKSIIDFLVRHFDDVDIRHKIVQAFYCFIERVNVQATT